MRSDEPRQRVGAVGERSTPSDGPAPRVELRGAGKRFTTRGSEVQALGATDLTVMPRQFLALVGPRGWGKSTVLNLMAGLLAPTEGTVLYNGAPITTLNQRVGYMTQKDTVLPWRTVESNVGISLELKCRDIAASDRRDRGARMLELVGLTGF